jgi:hypothetical protein
MEFDIGEWMQVDFGNGRNAEYAAPRRRFLFLRR